MRGRTLGATLTAVALLLAVAPAAAATEGSVPAVVTAYIASDLVTDLNEFYGTNADGEGIDFDETTTFSAADRIFAYTDDQKTDIELLNEWETRVSIAKKLVGLAIVTIDEATSEPKLASFEASVPLATSLEDLPADGALVRDSTRTVWLLVDGDTSTTLFSGTATEKGVSSTPLPTPLIGLGIGLVIVVFVVWLGVFRPGWWRRGPRPTSTDLLK
jgi:hypothetical protein